MKDVITLLDGITDVDNGAWVPCSLLDMKTIHVKGITNATLHVCGSCDPTKPANTVHEIQIGDDVDADALIEVNPQLEWIKVRCSVYTGGTISAFLAAKTRRRGV